MKKQLPKKNITEIVYNVTICNDLWMVIIIRVHFDAADTSLDLKNKFYFLRQDKKSYCFGFQETIQDLHGI